MMQRDENIDGAKSMTDRKFPIVYMGDEIPAQQAGQNSWRIAVCYSKEPKTSCRFVRRQEMILGRRGNIAG
jgi:hypothetical protein